MESRGADQALIADHDIDSSIQPPQAPRPRQGATPGVEELSSPRTPVIYEVVRRFGDEEMQRPATSLWWSGVAAGLSMSFSLLAQTILETHLPDTPWRPLL